jgi:hypothetical protein
VFEVDHPATQADKRERVRALPPAKAQEQPPWTMRRSLLVVVSRFVLFAITAILPTRPSGALRNDFS